MHEVLAQHFKGLSLVIFGNYWLALATTHLVGDNREFEFWGIFWALIPIKDGGSCQNVEVSWLVATINHPLISG